MVGAKDILVKITGDNKQFKSQMAGASGSMTGFAGTTAASTTTAAGATKVMGISMASSLALATAGITLILGALVGLTAGIAKITGETLEYANELDNLSEKTGISVETISAWGHAAKQAGVESNDLLEAIKDMTIKQGEAAQGNEGVMKTFNDLGINIRDVNGDLKDGETLFGEVATAIGNIEDPALQAAYANQLMADNGYKMLPVMNNMEDFINDTDFAKIHGIAMTEEEVAQARAFDKQLSEFKSTLGDVGHEIASTVMPILMDLLGVITWGAKHVLPPLIYIFKILLLPIKALIVGFKTWYEVILAAWAALTGDWDKAKRHYDNIIKLQSDYNNEIKETIGLKKEEAGITTEGVSVVAGAPSPTGGVGMGRVTGVTGGATQSLLMQNRKRLQELREQGITAAEYSGGKFDRWIDVQKSEGKIIQMAIDKGITGTSKGEEEIVTEAKIQTDTIKQSSNTVLGELKIQTGILNEIKNKVGGAGAATGGRDIPSGGGYSGISARDRKGLRDTADKWSAGTKYERTSGKFKISFSGNNSGV